LLRFVIDQGPIAVSDEDTGTILERQDAPGSGDPFLKGRFRLLHDADVEAVLDNVEAVLDKDVANALPAGTVCPSSVYQHDVLDRAYPMFGRQSC
jgi:hypothetical protein